MAKKFVRGITDIKTISNQDFDTNNVNDLLSDGQHNYIHRKKGNSEEYHNLTNNLKTIQSDDTDLLTVTNYNNTTNSATIRPKHDSQKEQVLESTDNTIVITRGTNGTAEKTTVDVNPEKVLEHDNLKTGYGIYKTVSENTSILGIYYTKVEDGFDLNGLSSGFVRGVNLTNAPSNEFFFVEGASEGNHCVQKATALSTPNTEYVRLKINGKWGKWREQFGDKELYSGKESYSHANATLKTFFKTVGNEEEFNFLAKMNKTQNIADFTLNAHDKAVFEYLIEKYGMDNKINVCGSAFTLNGSNLNFNTNGAQSNPHIITFSDIIPESAINVTQ